MEESNQKVSGQERQKAILVAALERAAQNDGMLLNPTQKLAPRFLDKGYRISPVNALMMAMHSDQGDFKTNTYTMFSEAKKRGESVRGHEKGVPFTWTNLNQYVSKVDSEDKISRAEFQKLSDMDKAKYVVNPREDTYILFNIDQTTMPHVHKEDYGKQIAEFGRIDDRNAEAKDGQDVGLTDKDGKQLRMAVNEFIASVKENLVPIKKDGTGIAHYDSKKDAIYMPAQKDFNSYPDYVQETVRQIAHATAVPGRLNRLGAVFSGQKVPTEAAQQREILVEELASAHKMLELGLPAKLRPETVKMIPNIIDQLKNSPTVAEKVLHDVNRTVGMIKKAESGEKILVHEKPSEMRQEQWASQFPLDKVPEKFEQTAMLKDDDGKWTLVAKPQNEPTFAIHPSKQEVSLYFDVIKNELDENKLHDFRTQFAQKQYAELAKDPSKAVNIFKSNASAEALALITNVNAFKTKDSKILLIAAIDGEKQKPVEINQNQWQRMWLADDKRDYKVHLAATLYSDVLAEKLESVKQATSPQVEGTPLHEENEHREYHEELNAREAEKNDKELETKYDLKVNDSGKVTIQAYTQPGGGMPIFDARRKWEFDSVKDALDILKNPANKMDSILEQVGKELQSHLEKEKKQELPPLLKQFYDLKKKHPDALLLFRTGDFYETYSKDAENASKALGITLTRSSRTQDKDGKPLQMAGFPYHALDTYLPKLIRSGFRVAICDQIEAPKRQQEAAPEQAKETQKQEVSQQEEVRRGMHR